MVSVATLGDSGLKLGPVQRTGTTSSSPQRATIRPSPVVGSLCAVLRVQREFMLANHLAAFSVSLVNGRDSLTVEYFSRVGSCQMCPLLPPSSRCSSTPSQPSPSQLLNEPSSIP